jgi:DNA mismatch endonuclease (patch repair protein)
MMSSVRNRDTAPELALRKAMWAAGIRGWRCHRSDLPGRPDVAFGRQRCAVFVDGAFWHGHPKKFVPGKSGAFWDEKIRRNQERDRVVDAALSAAGWSVLRLWDFEILDDSATAVARVKALLARTAASAPGRRSGSGTV